MKPHDQIMALGAFDGWTKIRMTIRGAGAPERKPSPYGVPPGMSYEATLPNYLTDLSAINYIENKLNLEQRMIYCAYLTTTFNESNSMEENMDKDLMEEIKKDTKMWGTYSLWKTRHATASQCAESLLKTLNLWTN